jgi:hypothetical protein
MAKRSPNVVVELLRSTSVVTFEQIQTALDHASRATTFRYLKQVPHLRSYNHNGRYYAAVDPAGFDRWGLASRGDVHFSHDGTLVATVRRLVREATAGWTQRELQTLLHVRVQVVLLASVREGAIQREQVGGFYLYLHGDPAVALAQRNEREARLELHQASDVDAVMPLDHTVIIQVLLALIRHPGSEPAQVVRYLYGHSPPITLAQVVETFAHYGLEEVSKKGGTTDS